MTITISSYRELDWTPAGAQTDGYYMGDYFGAADEYLGADCEGVGLAYDGRPLEKGDIVIIAGEATRGVGA